MPIENTPIDLVVFAYKERYLNTQGEQLYDHECPLPFSSCTYEEPVQWHRLVAQLEQSTHLGYVWNKLWRRDVLINNGLRFESVRLNEDILFSCAVLPHVRGVAFINEPLYTYIKQQGRSLTNANDYSASEYWSLHELRIARVTNLLCEWGVLDEAKPVLGSLYTRFVVSALGRSYQKGDGWTDVERRSFIAELRCSPLAQELLPAAQAKNSHVLSLAIWALRDNHPEVLIRIGQLSQLASTYAYPLFTRIRSGR